MLDGDGAGAHDHVGTSEGGDLDEYLKELDEGGADAAGSGGEEFTDVDDYLGELNLSDDDEAGKDPPMTDSPEKVE